QTWQLRRRSGPPHGGTCPDGYRALSTGELRELLRDDDKMDRIIRLNETKFMEGNVSVDEFLDAFQSSRKTYHVRRAQAEKTQEIAQATRQPCKSNPGTPLPGHGQPVGLRVIGQLSGGWPANGRPVRVQQLYRPNPQQPEPPFR
uniref:VPS37 C-terminal domain-containing protein n=1 Tax=Scophthalmus maximus TaxID=52904 RepID=A0A8D3E5Y1_SCOMX